VGEPEDGDLI